jgi:serine/threonine protein kinase
MPQSTPPLVRTVLDGKYQIEQALGSGAAGDVYEAIHLTLGSRVAVKVLRDGAAATADVRRRRFLREARLAAGIQSEHVVRVFDFAAHEHGPTYLVMELLQGETLAERLRRTGRLAIAEAVDYVLQAATPLAVLHESGIVHRDVKPSNLFLGRDSEGKERVKLLDFGVAAFRSPISPDESSATLSRAMIGTPRYMAPEQVRPAGLVDARADVWALGVTLYELLAGRPPFDAESVLTVLKQIERKNPAPLRGRRPAVPARLAALVESCLEKDRRRRPANARVVVVALEAIRKALGEPERDSGGALVDPLDLSLHDPDVEVLHPARPTMWRRAAIGGVLLCGFVLSAAIARQPGQAAQAAPAAAAPLARDGTTRSAHDDASGAAARNAPGSVAPREQPTPLPSDGTATRGPVDPSPRPSPATHRPGGKPAAPRLAPARPTAATRSPNVVDEPLE